MKNNNLTLLDPNQITVQQHDPEHDAQRVIVVGGCWDWDTKQTAEDIKTAIKDGFKDIKLDIPIPSPQIITTPQMDVEYVQVPVIVKETEFVEIEKPVIVTEVKIVEIEKPVIIKERELAFSRIEVPVIVKEYKDLSKLVYIFLGVQIVLTLIGLFAHK